MMEAVDKGDSDLLAEEEIAGLSSWGLMISMVGARAGLGRFRDFQISNDQLMIRLIDCFCEHAIGSILKLPDVKVRVDLYLDIKEQFKEKIRPCSTGHGIMGVVDLQNKKTAYDCSRSVVFTIYSGGNNSILFMWGLNKLNIVFVTGKSAVNWLSNAKNSQLMQKNGNGRENENANICHAKNVRAERVPGEVTNQINADD